MIPPETIDRVREAADVVQIIGEHVNLKRTGADYRGPCPFHQGTHRNFSVSPKKGIFYCFVCHEGGDVFTFVQKHLGLDWPAAVRYVAERSGVEVRETDARQDAPDEREPLWEVNAAAAEYFRRFLWESDAARPARDYLATRRVAREVADRVGLGFAPRDPAAVRAHLTGLGYDDARQLDAGLLVRREGEEEPRPRFRGRLMFPILDAAGRHVGFGGRVIGEGEPKYLNSAESRVFSKARLLYGLNWAKHAIRREDRVLVVEGYFDVLRVAAAGIEWVVAPLGTAFTEQQAALLRRYTRNAFLLFDSDKAGQKATFRTADELLRREFAVQVVTLPSGEDPDTFVAQHGRERLLAHVAAAVDVFERKVQLLERVGAFAELTKKRRALDRLLPTIRATADALTRDLYLTRASEAAGVSKELLQREVDALPERGPAAAPPPAPAAGAERPAARTRDRRQGERRRPSTPSQRTERDLVHLMLLDRARVERVVERVGPDEFGDPNYREIFAALLRRDASTGLEELTADLSPAATAVVQELWERPDAIVNPEQTMSDCLNNLECRKIDGRFREIDREMRIAVGAQKDLLLREKEALRDRSREIGCRRAFWKRREGHSEEVA